MIPLATITLLVGLLYLSWAIAVARIEMLLDQIARLDRQLGLYEGV